MKGLQRLPRELAILTGGPQGGFGALVLEREQFTIDAECSLLFSKSGIFSR